MTAQTLKQWTIVLAVIAAFPVLVFNYKQHRSYRCEICFAKNEAVQWRLGASHGPSLPLTPTRERITGSHFQEDFVSASHAHKWLFAQGSPYHFFGTTWGGCAIGIGSCLSRAVPIYESDPMFRGFIAEKLRDGSLTKSNFMAMMSIPSMEKPNLQKQTDALLNEFFENQELKARKIKKGLQ
jgi:hypothetical protein